MPRSALLRLRRSDPNLASDEGWEWDDFATGDFESGEDENA